MKKNKSITYQNAKQLDFMPTMQALVQAYQAFTAYDAAGYLKTDLTVPQADVIFTLGNTHGLSYKEIGEQTLITKGTLTGVIHRLEQKGLVKKVPSAEDGRSTIVLLTAKGNSVFQKEYPRQIIRLKQRFDRLSKSDLKGAAEILQKIRDIFV